LTALTACGFSYWNTSAPVTRDLHFGKVFRRGATAALSLVEFGDKPFGRRPTKGLFYDGGNLLNRVRVSRNTPNQFSNVPAALVGG